jgi:histidinol-phosphate aminotransferase
MRIVTETKALIVVDEAYMDFWDESQSLLCEIENYSNLIVLRTCSKSVGLAGIRLGFAVTNKEITNVLRMIKSPFNVNSLTQMYGAVVLSNKEEYIKSIETVKSGVKSLFSDLQELKIFRKIYDTKTNFVFVETDKAKKIYEYLLNKNIAVRFFGEYLRICTGTPEENKELIKELTTWKKSKT